MIVAVTKSFSYCDCHSLEQQISVYFKRNSLSIIFIDDFNCYVSALFKLFMDDGRAITLLLFYIRWKNTSVYY